VISGAYKNIDKVKTYAERSLQIFETLNPPEKYKQGYTEFNLFNLRDDVLANMNQFLGYYLIETRGDQLEAQDQALAYINKSIQVRSNDSKVIYGWKDPNNYSLRRTIYSNRYAEFRKRYDALTDEQKIGDTGKELIKQINQLLDTQLIPELARMIATATTPALKDMLSDATDDFNDFWKFRVDDPAKSQPYLKSFEADPTIEGPMVPAKADDDPGAEAPNVTGGNAKMSTGTEAVPGTGTARPTTKPKPPTRTRRKAL
jgi:hypothetical protein